MKKIAFILVALFTAGIAFSQDNLPINWTFTSKKISDNVYEIHMTATLDKGWHVYSQNQPKDAIAVPTSFSFNKNPLIEFEGSVKEVGKMEKFVDKVLDVEANQYSGNVTFVQKVKLKGKAKTNVTGKLEYQVCTEEKCLPAKTVNLSISL
jgi:thiol:disulfide interchange protein DsbD